ncbi:unnamed protein product, partial [Aphanomyces euteiches]
VQSASNKTNMWQPHRVVEFVVLVASAYIVSIPAISNDASDAKLDKKFMDTADFMTHYNVQFNRAVWSDVFREVDVNTAQDATVGVYVSGSKALTQAVDFELQGKSKFHVRNEEYEM